MTAQLKSHSQGQTLVLTLSNPEHRNALDPAMYSAGVEALNVAETNPDVRSVILTGEGKHFCAGGNFSLFKKSNNATPSPIPLNSNTPFAYRQGVGIASGFKSYTLLLVSCC